METTAISQTTASPGVTVADSAKSLAGLAGNFDNFLKILTAQLQHQDPLAPLDSNEFTSQLVAFTGVEQQIRQNKHLESLIELETLGQSVAAVSYIGKTIEANGDTNMLTDGETTFSYLLPESAKTAAIRVFNSEGEVVFQQPVDTAAGIHDFVWDGSNTQGGTEPDGVYSFKVSAVNADDGQINVTHRVVGRVNGIAFDNGKTILGIGDVGVPLDAVTGVKEPPDDSNQSNQG